MPGPDQPVPQSISMAGHLTVEEGKIFQQRFCLIDSQMKEMYIYTSDPTANKADRLGTINLQLVSMASRANSQSGPKQKYENCFTISSLGENYVFKANNSAEMQKWVEKINTECKVTVPKTSVSSSASEAKEEGGYSMAVVGGVVHKTLVDSLEEKGLSSDTDTEDELSSDYSTRQPRNVIKSGYAVKQGYIMKSWKRRFFVLDDVGISYYPNEQSNKPIRVIPRDNIIEARNSVGIHPNKGNLLEIVTKDRVFYLQVDKKEDVASWISAINTYVSETKDSIRNAEVQTTDSLERNASLHVVTVRENSQSTASQTTDFLRKKQSVKKPLPNRTVQSYSTYL